MTSSSKWGRYVKRLVVWWLFWSVLVVLGLALGVWQWDRADQKRDYLARLEQAPALESPGETPPEGAHITLSGEYLPDETLFLDNRVVEGRVGVAVLTPFRDDEGRLWLVQRGFLPTQGARATPEVETPSERVSVEGQWQPANDDALVFGENREGDRLQRIDHQAWPSLPEFAFEGWLHLDAGAGMLKPWWEPNVMPPSRHLGYAVQWWGLSLAALAIMLIGGRFLTRESRQQDDEGLDEEQYR